MIASHDFLCADRRQPRRRQLPLIGIDGGLAHGPARPRTRGDCVDGPRPCPWVSCAYNLFLDVDPTTGRLTRNRPRDVEPGDVEPEWSCALDVAERSDTRRDVAARALGLTTERIRQIYVVALATLLREHGPEIVELFEEMSPSAAESLGERLDRLATDDPIRGWGEDDRNDEEAFANDATALLRAGYPWRVAWSMANDDETSASAPEAQEVQVVEKARDGKPVERVLAVKLKDEEVLTRVQDFVQLDAKQQEIAERRRAMLAAVKEEAEIVAKAMSSLIDQIKTRTEMRAVACLEVLDGDVVRVRRVDTGETIEVRQATTADRQLTILRPADEDKPRKRKGATAEAG